MTPYDNGKISLAVQNSARPSREEAEDAVRTLLRWVGENPRREGLIDTPARVVRSYEEFFAGYRENAAEMLARTFEEVEGYSDLVMLRNIRVESIILCLFLARRISPICQTSAWWEYRNLPESLISSQSVCRRRKP